MDGIMQDMFSPFLTHIDQYKINYILRTDYIILQADYIVVMDCKYGREAIMTFD